MDELKQPKEKSPLEVTIDELWRDIILRRKPNYGDWEYGGQAYRHLLAEVREIEAERDAAVELAKSSERLSRWLFVIAVLSAVAAVLCSL